jgi:uncharacterized protein (TIGR02301 family)
MTGPAPRLLLLGLGLGMFASASFAVTPVAQAQFFWSPWLQEQPRARQKPRVRPKPPGDDLPPIVPKESSAPPPPDDRPYDDKLLRLAEILGAVHYLREVCGAQEGQLWRNQMKDILKNEGSTAVRRAKLVNSFNNGYRGYRRTYRTCTSSATLAIARFSTEGAQIAVALAKPSHYASRNAPAASPTPDAATGEAAPAPSGSASGEAGATANPQTPAEPASPDASAPAESGAGTADPAASATQPAEAQQSEANGEAASQEEQPRSERRRTRRAQPVGR